jgi:hypothetical protein
MYRVKVGDGPEAFSTNVRGFSALSNLIAVLASLACPYRVVMVDDSANEPDSADGESYLFVDAGFGGFFFGGLPDWFAYQVEDSYCGPKRISAGRFGDQKHMAYVRLARNHQARLDAVKMSFTRDR